MNKNLKKAMGLILSTALTLTLFSAYKNATHTTAKASEEKVLNIFTWDKYIPQNVLNQFKKETGIKINYSNFESNEEMLTKLKAAKGGSYDIVIASDYILDIARKSNLLSQLDKKKIPNYKNIDPAFQSQYYDSKNQYTVPYIAGTPLIVYDPKKVKIDIKGYNDLWNPALKDSVVTLDDQRNIIGITLKTLGKSFNTTDAATLKKAKEKLFKLKPNIRALDYNTPQNLLLNGEASVAYMFTAQVVAALNKRPDLKVVYPKEGMGFGIDNVVIPKNAPHKNAAHKFLNFILKPKVGADISSQLLYLCPNKAARKYLPKSFLNNRALYIPSSILGKTEFIKDVGKATKTYDQIWTEFKQK
jgi:spermidine/putrescine transport system substrate-binding protein